MQEEIDLHPRLRVVLYRGFKIGFFRAGLRSILSSTLKLDNEIGSAVYVHYNISLSVWTD